MGINMKKIIEFVQKSKGASARITLGQGQLRMARSQMCDTGKGIFDTTLGKLKDPKLDIAYKASKRGYDIAAVRIKDGKTVVGTGAFSITGLGTEKSAIKYRLNLGENGSIMSSSGFLDNAEQLNLDDVILNLTKRNGVTTESARLGKAFGATTRVDQQKLAEACDEISGLPFMTSSVAGFNQKITGLFSKFQQKVRNLFAGKEAVSKMDKKLKISPEDIVKSKKLSKESQDIIDKLCKHNPDLFKTDKVKNKSFIQKNKSKVLKSKQNSDNAFTKSFEDKATKESEIARVEYMNKKYKYEEKLNNIRQTQKEQEELRVKFMNKIKTFKSEK